MGSSIISEDDLKNILIKEDINARKTTKLVICGFCLSFIGITILYFN